MNTYTSVDKIIAIVQDVIKQLIIPYIHIHILLIYIYIYIYIYMPLEREI